MESTTFDYNPLDTRLTAFPIGRNKLYDMYTEARRAFWAPEEIDFSEDYNHFESLNPYEQRFVKYILAFFAASDGIVNVNLAERFMQEIDIREVSYFYGFQIAMEDIHAVTYSLILEAVIRDDRERNKLLNAIHTIPVIGKMSQFMFDCIKSDAPLAERLLRMACVEGIMFVSCFCAIYWLRMRGLMPGLGQANELIARDETMHTNFALELYRMIQIPLSHGAATVVIKEAVEIAKEFINDALPQGLAEMNSQLMNDYIECQADNIAVSIGLPRIYNKNHNFHFMVQINMPSRASFFEIKETNYSKAAKSTQGFETTDDF